MQNIQYLNLTIVPFEDLYPLPCMPSPFSLGEEKHKETQSPVPLLFEEKGE